MVNPDQDFKLYNDWMGNVPDDSYGLMLHHILSLHLTGVVNHCNGKLTVTHTTNKYITHKS